MTIPQHNQPEHGNSRCERITNVQPESTTAEALYTETCQTSDCGLLFEIRTGKRNPVYRGKADGLSYLDSPSQLRGSLCICWLIASGGGSYVISIATKIKLHQHVRQYDLMLLWIVGDDIIIASLSRNKHGAVLISSCPYRTGLWYPCRTPRSEHCERPWVLQLPEVTWCTARNSSMNAMNLVAHRQTSGFERIRSVGHARHAFST